MNEWTNQSLLSSKNNKNQWYEEKISSYSTKKVLFNGSLDVSIMEYGSSPRGVPEHSTECLQVQNYIYMNFSILCQLDRPRWVL